MDLGAATPKTLSGASSQPSLIRRQCGGGGGGSCGGPLFTFSHANTLQPPSHLAATLDRPAAAAVIVIRRLFTRLAHHTFSRQTGCAGASVRRV